MTKQKILVANWKANPLTTDEAKIIGKGIIKKAKKFSSVQTIVCPTFIHIESVAKLQKTKTIEIGSQDTYMGSVGAHTGEVTTDMLSHAGVSHVILGHSERRAMGETEQDVSQKLRSVLDKKMKAILCIGELQRDKDARYLSFIHDQLVHSLGDITKKDLSSIIIAYEPVWAIGRTEAEAMKGADMYEMVIFIQRIINDAFGKEAVKKVKILYGGSVTADNAEEILRDGHVDGFLVGRQSLYPENFGEIMAIMNDEK